MSFPDLVVKATDLLRQGQIPKAVAILERCLAVNLHDPMVLYLLGAAYQSQNYPGTAISHLSRAVDLRPDMDMAWHALGLCLRQMEYYEKAQEAYKRALDINPDRPDTLAMMAGAYVNIGNPGPGEEYGWKAVEMKPSPEAWTNLSFCLLEQGKWQEGWEAYEHRWEVPENKINARDYGDTPKWDGGPLDGILVIHGEQGLGDEILFMTLLDEVKQALGHDQILVECAPRLVEMFERSLGVQCYGTDKDLKEDMWPADEIKAWIPMGDLPRFFRNTDKSFGGQLPYLTPDPELLDKWRRKLEKLGPGPYVGISWFGGNQQTHQSLRCVPLEQWQPILDQDCTFVSVQYGVNGGAYGTEGKAVTHWNDAVHDFDELTALIAACDLTITVLQTTVHQAGAMGKPCWTLTPKGTSWQFGLEGERMLWHKSVKQFRKIGDDWSETIERIAGKLKDFTP